MSELLKESDYWSPSKSESTVGTKHVAITTAEPKQQEYFVTLSDSSLFRALINTNSEALGRWLGRGMQLEEDGIKLLQESTQNELATAEAEYRETVLAFRKLQGEFDLKSQQSLELKRDAVKTHEAHKQAVRNVKNIQESKPTRFALPEDIQEWEARLTQGRAISAKALEAMNDATNAYNAHQAGLTPLQPQLNALAAKEKTLRERLASLRNEPEAQVSRLKAELQETIHREQLLRKQLAMLGATGVNASGIGL